MFRNLLLMVVVALLVGCATNPAGTYGNPNDDVYGSKRNLEYPQRSVAIVDMVGKMVTDPYFTEVYEVAAQRAAQRGHRRPTVIITDIEDNTVVGGSDFSTTRQIHQELKTALRKTGKFSIIDLYERARMSEVSEAEINGGGVSDNLQNFGEYASGDFHMFGELSKEKVSHSYFHFFNLRMIDPTSGEEIWSDTVKVLKQ